MKIVLAFDSFKGSLTAEEAVTAARCGVLSAWPDADVIGLPLADGGEGTTDALVRYMAAHRTSCRVCDPLFRKIETQFAVSHDGRTAVMDMASAAGLTLLTEEERNPMSTTTFGVGEMIRNAINCGCTRILIGIGGSATNDGGMGMLAALGAHFYNEQGETLKPVGRNLARIAEVDWEDMTDLDGVTIDVVCDVDNPLYGQTGAAYVYAAQKGASADEVAALDNGLRHWADVCARRFPQLEEFPGSGAAGGLGYGLLLIGANLKKGTDVILDAAHIDHHLATADLVLTGEGKIDRQTLNGKLPCGVLQRADKYGVPVIALAGAVEDETLLLQAGFRSVHSINPPGLSTAEAMNHETASRNLTRTITTIYEVVFNKLPRKVKAEMAETDRLNKQQTKQ